MNSEAVKMKRQQIKIMQAIKKHHDTMKSLSHNLDHRLQTLIVDHLKSKSDMKEQHLSDVEKYKLLQKEPGPFTPDIAVDSSMFHFGHSLETYREFIEENESKARKFDEINGILRNPEHPLLRMPDLTKVGWKRCEGCGKLMFECDDTVYGPYCVYKVIDACNQYEDFVCDVTVKKIFIDCYNRCRNFVNFKLPRRMEEQWVFPPRCVQDNSYAYAIFWYEWIVEGKYELKNLNEEGSNSDKGSY